MIHSISSNNKKFKTINFHDGLNIIVADKTEKSTDKDTRNGLGKSTLLNIIHFCLGRDPKEALANSKTDDYTFYLDMDIQNKRYVISRSPGNKTQIFVKGDTSDWPIQPKIDPDTQKPFYKKDQWNMLLGNLMFGLSLNNEKFNPTFRSLISYVARKKGGFDNPFSHTTQQLEWDRQANNAYLLELNWKHAEELEFLKQRLKNLRLLKKELQSEDYSFMFGNEGDLESEKVRLNVQLTKIKNELDDFKVNQQYEEIEQEANSLTNQIQDHNNENFQNDYYIQRYSISLQNEKISDINQIKQIYEESNFHFSENIIKKLEDVNNFHKKIIENRKNFLEVEIKNLKYKIEITSQLIEEKDNKRSKLLKILNAEGALSEFSELQGRYTRLLNTSQDIDNRLSKIQKIKNIETDIKIKQQTLYQIGSIAFKELHLKRDKAIEIFGNYSSILYDEFGKLSIGLSETGFKFNINIKRSSSQGIENMQIFCYDLTIATLLSKKNTYPGFLFHDSIIFDGVDERQIASALDLSQKISNQNNFQYICSLNSDIIPHQTFPINFDFSKYVVITLTDSNENGSLLGMRF